MKILVIHEGRRDNYQVAQALCEAGHEVHLVTTGYGTHAVQLAAKLFNRHSIRKLAARVCPWMRDEHVHTHLMAELASRVFRRTLGEAVCEEWLNRRLTATARRVAIEHQIEVLVAYNYNAFKLFNSSRKSLKIIFQCHPHPLLIIEEFARMELLGFATSTNSEKELSYGDEYQAMLMAEPHLADAVLCASTFTLRSLVESGVPESRISVIPYGVGSRQSKTALPPSTSSKLRLLFVGQFVERKGLRILVEILRRTEVPFEITLVGRGNFDFDVAEALKGKGFPVSVVWDATDEKLAEIYAASDVFLFPSIIEGFAHVILEAMSHGCVPVVSANTCGPDVVEAGVSGFVFQPENVDGFVDALHRLADRSAREPMSLAAKHTAERFTWDRFRREVSAEINQVIEKWKKP